MPFVIPFIAAALTYIGVGAETATFIATTIVNIAISVALSEIATLIEGGPKKPNLHAQRENLRNPIAPRRRYYGRVKISGIYVFINVTDITYGPFTDINALHLVIALAQGEFDDFEEHWLSDAKAFLDDNNVVIMPYHFYQESPFIRIFAHDGTDNQAADTLMTTNWPGQWTSDFHGYGVPYVSMILFSPTPENFNSVYSAGLPSYSGVCRAAKLWDPRDQTQQWSDRSTWKWSSNGALAVLDVLWSNGGVRLPLELILPAISVWQNQADYADKTRLLKNGGSEAWYRLCGGFEFTDPPKNWLPKMLAPMDARLGMRGDGAIVLDVGRWRLPELTISDNEIVGYQNLSQGKQKADIRNQIDATFVAPEYGYVEQQADSWLNEDSIDTDGLQQTTLDLGFCPSHAQARTIQKIEAFRQDSKGWFGTIITKAYGLKYLTPNSDGTRKRFVHFQIAELGIDCDFEVLSFAFDYKTGRCTFAVGQMSGDAYDWDAATDEGTAPEIPATTNTYGFEDPFNLAISVSGSVISATIATPENIDLLMELGYRISIDGRSDWEVPFVPLTPSGWGGHTGTLDDGSYDVRVRLYDSRTPPRYSNPLVIRGILIGNGIWNQAIVGPTDFTVVNDFELSVKYEMTIPSIASVVSYSIYAAEGSGATSFADTHLKETFDCSPGESISQTSNAAYLADTWNFWVVLTDVFGNQSTPVGPDVLVVTN